MTSGQLGPGFVPTFLYYFISTTFIVAFVISNGLDSVDRGQIPANPWQIGILLGIVAGGIGAYFNYYQQIELPIQNQVAEWQRLSQVLTQMGYSETREIDHIKVYERSFPSNLFTGKLLIYSDHSSITISGRASRVRVLRKRLEFCC